MAISDTAKPATAETVNGLRDSERLPGQLGNLNTSQPNNSQALALPRRGRGRTSVSAELQYQSALKAFCSEIVQIRSTLDFDLSARGWCYILEDHGLRKGDFSAAEGLIADCRKSGLLPIDIVGEDSGRSFENLEEIHRHDAIDDALSIVEWVKSGHKHYHPVSFWDFQPTYIEMLVEKVDLRNLFAPVCAEYKVPIANVRGWSDINTRASIMRRFRDHEKNGRRCVLLYCGDHDPAGLSISTFMRSNLEELAGAVGWRPDNLVIKRFGLNADFIEEQGLSWIEGLDTSSGKSLADPSHAHHQFPYVREYLKRFGARKVEANALVVRPEAGRALCREAIERHIDPAGVEQYHRELAEKQAEVADIVRQLLADGSA
jgi:hypothetical protein